MIKNSKVHKYLALRLKQGQKGQILLEVLIALAILGIVAVAYLTAITTSSYAIILADEKTTAESLTRTQLESIKNSEYIDYSVGGHGTYPTIPDSEIPDGYSLTVEAVPIDPVSYDPIEDDSGIQKITVEVYHHPDRLVLTTTTYKIKR